jgi:hypothetical protein
MLLCSRACWCCLFLHQVERAVLDLCLDPSDSYLAAVAVDIGAGLEGSVSSSVRLYEVGRQRPDEDDEDSDAEGVLGLLRGVGCLHYMLFTHASRLLISHGIAHTHYTTSSERVIHPAPGAGEAAHDNRWQSVSVHLECVR